MGGQIGTLVSRMRRGITRANTDTLAHWIVQRRLHRKKIQEKKERATSLPGGDKDVRICSVRYLQVFNASYYVLRTK